MAICQSGQYERAEAFCIDLLASMSKHEMRTFEPLVLRMRGLSVAHSPAGDVEAGRKWIRRAREVAKQQGAFPEIAHADLALARLSADQGNLDDAKSLARSALRAYRRMSMTEWEPRAETVLAIS